MGFGARHGPAEQLAWVSGAGSFLLFALYHHSRSFLSRSERTGFGAALLEIIRSHSSLGPKTLVARAHGGGICKCVGSLETLSFRSGNPRKRDFALTGAGCA